MSKRQYDIHLIFEMEKHNRTSVEVADEIYAIGPAHVGFVREVKEDYLTFDFTKRPVSVMLAEADARRQASQAGYNLGILKSAVLTRSETE